MVEEEVEAEAPGNLANKSFKNLDFYQLGFYYFNSMDTSYIVLLWFFIFLRVVIFFGIVYFILIEYRKYRRRREENEGRD